MAASWKHLFGGRGTARRFSITLIGLVGCLAGSVLGGTVYVNGTTGSDAWDGRCEVWDGGTCGPKATIQAGLDAALVGETVLVAEGTYTGSGNQDLDFSGKAITLRSAGGPAHCTIAAVGDSNGFYFHHNEGPASVVDGFSVVASGYPDLSRQGVYCYYSAPTLMNCTMSGFYAQFGGCGLSLWHSSPAVINCQMLSNGASDASSGGVIMYFSSPSFVRCRIADNHGPDLLPGRFGGGVVCLNSSSAILNGCVIAHNWGESPCGGVCCDASSNATLTNCSIAGNWSFGGLGVWADGDSTTLRNCVVWGSTQGAFGGSGIVTATYSDIQGGWSGTGNINADPLFVDAASYDYHLTAASPCIDAGDPAFDGGGRTDFDGLARLWDGDGDGVARVDMGAHEYGSFRYGDLNCDSAVNAFDIDPFVLALTDPAGYAVQYPDCDAMLADTNGDWFVNAFDIDPFVDLLVGDGR